MQVKAAVIAAVVAALLGFSSGPAFAAQVTCGEVITQDTRLGNDLIGCPGDGLVVGADDITLDLNGHRIEGRVPLLEFTAVRGSADGVTVKDGTIGVFSRGIHLDGNNNRVENNVITDSTHPLEVIGDGNVIEDNRSDGEDGMGVIGNENVMVGNSVDSGHGGLGAEGDRNLIERNSVFADGSIFTRGLQNQILRNVAHHGVQTTVVAYGAQAVIERNVVPGASQGSSIAVHLSEGARIARNVVSESPEEGSIHVETSSGAVVERNVVSSGHQGGIHVETSSGAVVDRNVISSGHLGGIRVETSSGAVVERNRVSGLCCFAENDGFAGIFAGPSIVVTKNVASFNDGLGIYGEPGVIDGGGNRAFGNTDPRQCVNISCK